jgi:hypothetical protein
VAESFHDASTVPPATRPGWKWSLLALAAPVGAVACAFAAANGLKDETLITPLILGTWTAFFLFALFATRRAFLRREKGRWLTCLSFLLLLTMMFGGASSG